jgi:2-C-methyl-D-erythritol 4-phosphate cytidylyltransferase
MNIGIILAAGLSTRFNSKTSKQLYKIHNKHIIQYSIDAFLLKNIRKIIIVTNTKCYYKIYKIIVKYYQKQKQHISIIINDYNCRLESMQKALNYINSLHTSLIKNIIIHDSARPFITKKHIKHLINTQRIKQMLYTQYYIKLTNGLARFTQEQELEFVDRDKYIEICTPLCIDYQLFNKIMNDSEYNQNGKRLFQEFIPVMNILNLQSKYHLLEGHYYFLRKITTTNDLV